MLRQFKDFLSQRIYGLAVIAFGLMAYGILLFNPMIGIDDESLKHYIASGLIAQDRVGWSLVSKIVNIYELMPFWTNFVGLIIFVLSLCFVIMLVDNASGKKFRKVFLTICVGMGCAYPYIAKFAIYGGNLATIGICMGLCGLAVYCFEKYWDRHEIRYALSAVICMWGVFLFEKAYIVFVFQIWIIVKLISSQTGIKDFLRISVGLATAIAAYVLSIPFIAFIQKYSGISPTGYTSLYIKYSFNSWNDFITTFQSFWSDYFDMLSKQFSEAGGFLIVVSMIVILLWGIFNSIRKKNIGIMLMSLMGILLANAVYLITGYAFISLRTVCFNFMLCVLLAVFCIENFIYDLKISSFKVSGIRFAVYVIILIRCTASMENIFYTKYITYHKDVTMMDEIMYKIYEADGLNTNKPVIFMGIPNNSNYSWKETEESSVFVWDRGGDSYSEETSARIYHFFELHGYELHPPGQDFDFKEVRKNLADLKPFPLEGCIKAYPEYILVKLGDSLCEILDSSDLAQFQEVKAEDVVQRIDYFFCENRYISGAGYVAFKDSHNYSNNYSIIFDNGQIAYKLRTMEQLRKDVTEYYNSGFNFDNTGFKIEGTISNYITGGSYDVFISIENLQDRYLFNTGLKVNIE